MTAAPADDLDQEAWDYILDAIRDKLDGEIGFSQPTRKEVIERVAELSEVLRKLRKNYFVWNLLKGM